MTHSLCFRALLLTLFVSVAPVYGAPAFETARPMLEQTCFECHGGKTKKGGVDLKKLQSEPNVAAEFELWSKVQEVVRNGEMPPDDAKKPLSAPARETLLSWVDAALDTVARANAGDPGAVTLRRLTNAEYDYTVRDLTGVDLQAGRASAPDGGGGEGFSNLGD